MKELIKFNLNDYIHVNLTDDGFKYWKENHDKVFSGHKKLKKYIRTISYYKEKADKNGYVRFQAWDFINIFGDTVEMGTQPLFDLTLLIEI